MQMQVSCRCAEMQRCRAAELELGFSRGDCAGDCLGASTKSVERRCRCRGQIWCRDAEMQRCRDAEVQRCRGAEEVQRCRYSGAEGQIWRF